MAHCWYQNEEFRIMAKVGKVSRLVLYPVKSMQGIEVPYLECTREGFEFNGIEDRHWMVATSDGVGVTRRHQPRLELIRPSFHGNMLHLDTKHMETLKIPRDVPTAERQKMKLKLGAGERVGIDCGKEASQWLSQFLGTEGLRLVYADDDTEKFRLNNDVLFGSVSSNESEVVYHDAFAGSLVAETSLQDLNSRLVKPVTIDRFRGNIIVSDSRAPFIEEEWKQLRIGESLLSTAMTCPRCLHITIDPATGKQDPNMEPLRTLKLYRDLSMPETTGNRQTDWPSFGTFLTVQKPGTIRVGDTIMATKEASNQLTA